MVQGISQEIAQCCVSDRLKKNEVLSNVQCAVLCPETTRPVSCREPTPLCTFQDLLCSKRLWKHLGSSLLPMGDLPKNVLWISIQINCIAIRPVRKKREPTPMNWKTVCTLKGPRVDGQGNSASWDGPLDEWICRGSRSQGPVSNCREPTPWRHFQWKIKNSRCEKKALQNTHHQASQKKGAHPSALCTKYPGQSQPCEMQSAEKCKHRNQASEECERGAHPLSPNPCFQVLCNVQLYLWKTMKRTSHKLEKHNAQQPKACINWASNSPGLAIGNRLVCDASRPGTGNERQTK